MNISYPTVKKYLDEAITSLGYSVDEDDEEPVRVKVQPVKIDEVYIKNKQQEILNKIKTGEIKVEEAIKIIKKVKGETE